MNKQQGFSLIELAIVLVIAGLLLAGVMRGQELIANAKVKGLAADFRNIPTYLYGYQDRFRVLPGDDHAANTHLTGGINAASTTQAQDGLIQGAWNSTSADDESYVLWQHLRLAGLMNGSATTGTAQYIPRNGEGGQIGLASVSNVTELTATGLSGSHLLCSEGILGRYALQLDTMLDDGVGDTGSMRVLTKGAVASAGIAVPVNSTAYLVCMSF